MKAKVSQRTVTVFSTDLIILRLRELTPESLKIARHLSAKLKGALCLVMGPKDRIEQFPFKEQLALYGGLQRRLQAAGLLEGGTPALTPEGKEAAKREVPSPLDELTLPEGAREAAGLASDEKTGGNS